MIRPEYSYIKHWALSVLMARYSGDVPMAFFTAYFDASGHPDDPVNQVMTVAGFVSTIDKWIKFEAEWNAILQSEGITIFHMTDFVSGRGEFAVGWKGETDRRRIFIERLAACLAANVIKSFRATLVISDYHRVNQKFKIEETLGKPYALCAMMCAYTLRQWAESEPMSKPLLYYFEDGDADKGNFEAWHERTYGERPRFQNKKRAVMFQPADFAGWKMRSAVQNSIKANHTLAKGQQLLRSVAVLSTIPKEAGVITEPVLLKYCFTYNVPKR